MSDQSTDNIHKVPGTSPNFMTELARQLHNLVPEAMTDGKVDTKKLQELIDGDSADDSERFGLFWPGKKRAMRAAQEPTTATLKPAKEESKDWESTENIFIEGDNLEVLKVLQKNYHNKVKMIYIDPPYNTGHDFVYPDNYKEGLASYLEFTKQVDEEGRKISTNSDSSGRYHSNWLNMIYPRLKLARNLLTDNGIIFISIDDHEQDNLKKVCNEIFGESNLVGVLPWNGKGGGADDKYLMTSQDYILFYARNKEKFQVGRKTMQVNVKEYNYEDDRGKFKKTMARKWGKNSRREDRPNLFYPVKAPDGSEVSPKLSDGRDGRWRFSRAQMAERTAAGNIIFEKNKDDEWVIYEKDYLTKENKTQLYNSWLDYAGTNADGAKELKALFGGIEMFDHPKPTELIFTLAQIGGVSSGDVVMDFFSGSATTGHAILQLNAMYGLNVNHIQVQLPEPTDEKTEAFKAGYKNIAEVSKKRLLLSGDKVQEDFQGQVKNRENPLDVGFKTYKLSETNFTKWKSSSNTDKEATQQNLLDMRNSSNDSSSEIDLLTEVILKLGISLTAKIEKKEIDNLSLWNVGNNIILAYLNENIKPTLDQLRSIANSEPAKIVLLEDAFQGDDELKTNLSQICKTNKIELWTV